MDESVKKAINLGLGAIVMTKEKIQSVVDELADKGKVSKEEGRELFETLVQKGELAGKQVESAVRKAAAELDLPTRKEFRELQAELEKIKEKIQS